MTAPPRLAVPLHLVTVNLHKAVNAGVLARLAAATGAELHLAAESISHELRAAKRAAAGAGPHARISYRPDVGAALREFKAAGVKLVATCPRARRLYTAEDYTGPVAFLFGNEAQGLDAETLALADASVSIPMSGAMESLNLALSAAILVYEALRQRGFRFT